MASSESPSEMTEGDLDFFLSDEGRPSSGEGPAKTDC